MNQNWLRLGWILAWASVVPFASGQTAKSDLKAKDRFKILSAQAREIETLIGIPKQGNRVPFKLLAVRITVNDKAEAKGGLAPTPKFLVCHFYNQKKEEIATAPATLFRVNADNDLQPIPPEFKSKTPTEVFFPYDSKITFRYAIIVVGDESGIIAYSHPTSVKTFGDFDFPEKIYLARE